MTKKTAQVFHFDLQGKRDFKYNFLNENSINSIDWNELQPDAENAFFVNKNFEGGDIYEKGFKIDEVFNIKTSGVKTHDDANLVSFQNFTENTQNYTYKLFDNRHINYDLKKVQRHRFSIMKNMLKENLGLCLMRGLVDTTIFSSIFITNNLLDINFFRFQTYLFPLYLYPETTTQQTLSEFETLTGLNGRKPNLNMEIVNKMAKKLGVSFVLEKPTTQNLQPSTVFAPIDILDYIYAVLHSPSYREKYKEFLKIDFPRVPFPANLQGFQNLVALGSQLRQIHLLESDVVEKLITQYPVDGDNVVVKLRYEINPVRVLNSNRVLGNVYINETQYFANVPQDSWNFYIGGYQPAQKWLKDRKDRELSYEDIRHYQKIIVALTETDRLMKEIDKIET